MKFYIIAWGKLKEDFYKKGVTHYVNRVSPHAHLIYKEFKEKISSPKELDRIIKELPENHERWVLDERGELFTTKELATIIQDRFNHGISSIVFFIGGPYGDPNLKNIAHRTISLSPLTFPHRLARLILVEQIYRVVTIIKNIPYNH